MRRFAIASLLLVAFCGCKQDPDPDVTDPPWVDLTEPLGPDEARAGQLDEDHDGAFIGGAAGESRPGDYLLYNDRARFAVRGLRPGHFCVGEPGSIIDLDIVRPDGQADRDGMDDLMTIVGLPRLFVAESYQVVNNGLDGGAAVLEVTGTDQAFTYLEGAIEAQGMFPPRGLTITQTFTLEPGSPALELTTTVHNTTSDDALLDIVEAGMVDLATYAAFIPGGGFEDYIPDGGRSMMAMVSHRNDQALAVYKRDGTLAESSLVGLGDEFDMVMAGAGTLVLGPGETGSVSRMVGVARDLATLEAHRRQLQGQPAATVEGTVTASGTPVAGARVFLTDDEGRPHTMAVTDDEGFYRIVSHPGDVQLVVVGDGSNEQSDLPAAVGNYGTYAHTSANELATRAFADPEGAVAAAQADGFGRSEPIAVTLTEGDTTLADLTLTEPATLRIHTRDGLGTAMPATVHLMWAEGHEDPAPADSYLGEHRPRGGARKVAWVIDGEMDIPIVPGTYDVIAHRGFLYELGREDAVTLSSGQVTELTLTLDKAHDTTGYISGDMHSHASPSLDGECLVEERLAGAAAAGLQVHIATDHDHISDYRPLATAMGLDPWLVTVPGDEISTVMRGHFNIYPANIDPDAANHGSPRWWENPVTTTELLESFREPLDATGILQVNHGRDSGMFEDAGYNPTTGQPANADFYSDNFDVMEILNSGDIDMAEELRLDWCGHMDAGLRRTAVGVSDAHGRLAGAGYARTYVAAGTDDVTELVLDDFFAQLKAGHAIVSGGPFVTLQADDGDGQTAGIGDTMNAASATLQIQVWAPSWMIIDEVLLYASGCQVEQVFAIDAGAVEAPLWFDEQVEVFPTGSGYYFVEVRGYTDMTPVWPGQTAYALTNPIFFEE